MGQREQVYGLNLIDVNASDSIDCVTCACNTPPIVGNVSMNDGWALRLPVRPAMLVLSSIVPILRAPILEVENLS